MVLENFKEALQSLNLKMINSAKVGGGAGSIVKLEFEETRNFIFIYCTWRLEHSGIVLSTSDDDSTALTGLMASTIRRLENKRINHIDSTPQHDLTLFLDDDYVLRVFCNVSYSNIDYLNWKLCCPQMNVVYTINNEFRIDATTYY